MLDLSRNVSSARPGLQPGGMQRGTTACMPTAPSSPPTGWVRAMADFEHCAKPA
jgi:hypothetical protein